MTDIKVIQAAIEQIAPPHLAEEWDNSGFQIRCDEAQKIRKILVCLEISDEVVAEAIADKADLIITHHPLIFGKINKVDHKNITGNQIIRLIQAGISVYSAHTSFDSARRGTNQYLAEQIGLEEIMPLVPASEEGCGMGRIGIYSSPVSPDDFLRRLKSACDENIYRVAGELPEKIAKVSMCTGAGAEFIQTAKENGSDVYITGDVKYHDARMACDIGMCVVDAGHFGTENIFSVNFAKQLSELLPKDIGIILSKTDVNPFHAS